MPEFVRVSVPPAAFDKFLPATDSLMTPLIVRLCDPAALTVRLPLRIRLRSMMSLIVPVEAVVVMVPPRVTALLPPRVKMPVFPRELSFVKLIAPAVSPVRSLFVDVWRSPAKVRAPVFALAAGAVSSTQLMPFDQRPSPPPPSQVSCAMACPAVRKQKEIEQRPIQMVEWPARPRLCGLRFFIGVSRLV